MAFGNPTRLPPPPLQAVVQSGAGPEVLYFRSLVVLMSQARGSPTLKSQTVGGGTVGGAFPGRHLLLKVKITCLSHETAELPHPQPLRLSRRRLRPKGLSEEMYFSPFSCSFAFCSVWVLKCDKSLYFQGRSTGWQTDSLGRN